MDFDGDMNKARCAPFETQTTCLVRLVFSHSTSRQETLATPNLRDECEEASQQVLEPDARTTDALSRRGTVDKALVLGL